MQTDDILDDDFSQLIQEYLMEKEGIVWRGKPQSQFTVTLLEFDGYFDVMTGPSSVIGYVFGGMAIGGYYFYTKANWTGFVLTMLIGIAIILFPDVIKNIRKKNTRYAFTKNRIFFKLWRWGKRSIHFIDLADIEKISYQEYKDKSGVVHFMSGKPFGFHTYDFLTGRKRDYPTFEMVPNVIELTERLEELRKERVRGKV